MERKYITLNFTSLDRTKYWMNAWSGLDYKVISFTSVSNIFGRVTRYLVLMEKERKFSLA